MRIIVVGGGKVGNSLSNMLLENGHDVCIIEKDPEKCVKLADALDIVVINGDGTSIETLSEAGARNCDALVAVTGNDEDNLIACQLGKMEFNAGKTVARANNAKNVEVMRMLNVDYPVSSTRIIANMIEERVDTHSMKLLATISQNGEISQITVPKNAEIVGQPISSIKLPKDSLIISVVRQNEMIIPRGDTVIKAGDEVLAVSTERSMKALVKMMIKEK